MKMFRRRQSLRRLVGTSFRNQAVAPSPQPQKLTNYKKQISKKRMSPKNRKKKNNALQRCMKTIEKKWNAASCKLDTDGNCKITTPDGRFDLNVSGPTPAGSLFISTCIYTCTSVLQSETVARNAAEMNTFLGAMGDQDYKYVLKVNPPSPLINKDDMSLPVKIFLRFSCSMEGLFNVNHKTKSNDGGDEDEKLFAIIKEFAETALNFQTKLETVDKGRLGMAPRPEISEDSNIPHIELLANPPSIVTKFMNGPVKSTVYLAATKSNASESLRYQASRKLEQVMRKAHTTSKSAGKILSQFSSPEEAQIFHLYRRQKSKRRRAASKQYSCSGGGRTVATDVSQDSHSIASKSLAPKRTVSLPIATGNRNSMVIPKPPELIDWNRTPVISNKGLSSDPRENGTKKATESYLVFL